MFQIAYPEKFTYVDDPVTNHIDTFTKAYIKLSENLREDLNMRCENPIRSFNIFIFLKTNSI